MKTIKENTISKYEINKSIFICCLYKINSIDEVKTYLEEAKNNFKDATHYTYAYIIDEARKSSDDGEPGGTAGVPIMEVLLKHELNYVLCIVIRYFGGIKLGAGGLIRAYSKATRETLKNSVIEEYILYNYYELSSSYDDLKLLNNLSSKFLVVEKRFDEKIIYKVKIEPENDKINEVFLNTNIKVKKLENI